MKAGQAAIALALLVLAGCTAPIATTQPGETLEKPANVGGSDKVVTSVFPGKYNFTGPYSSVLTPGDLKIKPAQRIVIPSTVGGEGIEMGLHLPETSEKVPVIVFASPYFFADGSPGGSRTITSRAGSVGSLINNFVPHGYAFVSVAVRGTAGSGGCNDLMGPAEIADLDTAITWVGTQPWSSGAVAMTGVSYDGSTPWSVASTGNPYLKTILPISGVPDMYGLMYRNGSSEARGPVLLNALYVTGSYASGTPADIPDRLCPEAYEGLALSAVAGAAGEDPTGYWEARNRKPHVEANYKGSVFSIQGLQDWNVDPSQVIPWVDELDAKGIRTRQLLGQWGHAWPDGIGAKGANAENFRADWKEIMLRWLDQELKGKVVDVGAPVQVRDDLGRWRNEEHYPPRDTNWTTWHLTQGFLREKPGARESLLLLPRATEEFPPQPPPTVAASPHTAADFYLAPAKEDLLVIGLPKVHVTVTPQGPGGYMGAYLYDVAPGGSMRAIGWTTMNLAFADGDRTRSEVVPGQQLLVKMQIQPMDSVVKAGHQLMLRLWVFTDTDRLPTLPPSSVTLETGEGIHSVIELPTIVRDPSVYFKPPMPGKSQD